MALFVQGKLYKFKECAVWFFVLLFIVFFAIFIGFLIAYFRFLKKRFTFYKKIKYTFEIDLSESRNYIYLCLGGLLGGFSSGLIGVGSGHIMILFMSFIKVQTKVASATSGYQILFVGASSLIEAVA